MFYIAEAKNIGALKGIVVKALQEINFLKMQEENAKQSAKTKTTQESSEPGPDAEWLESQIVADR